MRKLILAQLPFLRILRNLKYIPIQNDTMTKLAVLTSTILCGVPLIGLLFQAKKFFPYGFGPGNRVEILDAADSDDDEDEGGTYQVLDCKGLGVGGISLWFPSWE